ncbi:hypothetical protein JMUB7514_27760 [Staphylococcus aureus]
MYKRQGVTFDGNLAKQTWDKDYQQSHGLINFDGDNTVSYTHLRAHETTLHLVCCLLLEKIHRMI